jgi:hypothetical protein
MAQREATFGDDLAASLRVWREAPALPLLTVAIGIAASFQELVGPGGFVIALPATLVLAGWVGTQRIWYLRLFRGMTLESDEYWHMTWAFVGRYVVLGFLMGIPLSLLFLPVSFAVQGQVARAAILLLYVFVADFVLTFVTPALAFSTGSALEALAIGWRTLWDGWPATAPYGLVAPLVIIGLGQVLGRALGAAAIVLTILGTLLGLWFKGATTAYYLRHHEVRDKGAT